MPVVNVPRAAFGCDLIVPCFMPHAPPRSLRDLSCVQMSTLYVLTRDIEYTWTYFCLFPERARLVLPTEPARETVHEQFFSSGAYVEIIFKKNRVQSVFGAFLPEAAGIPPVS